MARKSLKFGLLMLLGFSSLCWAQKSVSCRIDYANDNQLDYEARSRVGVHGDVVGPDARAIPNACIAVFTEDGHRFVLGRTSDARGKFDLPLLGDGSYRLVVKVEGYGIANMKFKKVPETFADSLLHVHMKARSIDVTSYIDSK